MVAYIENISLPSKVPPFLITSPTPIPSIIPPKTHAKNGSVINGGNFCKYDVATDSTIIPNTEATENPRPICLYPKYKMEY